MLTKMCVGILSMAVLAAFAPPAMAGTKVKMSLVLTASTNPPTPANPTMDPAKGKISMNDKGVFQASLAGVTDAGGVLVNSGSSLKNSLSKTLDADGNDYIVIVKLQTQSGNIPAELTAPIALKKGGGKVKIDLAGLFSLVGPTSGKGIAVLGAEVWGPVGAANVAACQTVVTGALGGAVPYINIGPDFSPCRVGDNLGVAGVALP